MADYSVHFRDWSTKHQVMPELPFPFTVGVRLFSLRRQKETKFEIFFQSASMKYNS